MGGGPALDFIRDMDQRMARAWPAAETHALHGWTLRYSEGASRRIDSVLTAAEVPDPGKAIRKAEAYYRDRGAPPRFQLSPGSPRYLWDELLARGYEEEAPTMVCTAPLDGVIKTSGGIKTGGGDFHIDAEPNSDWADIFASGLKKAEQREKRLAAARRAPPPKICAGVSGAGRVKSAGLAVLDERWVGLFGLATAPECRGRGLGGRLFDGMIEWARGQGAAGAYLQVEEDNPRARALYRRLGFQDAYRYWYALKQDA